MDLFIDQPKGLENTVVVGVGRGTGMGLFTLHLVEMARQAGYTVKVFPATVFGVYSYLDQERFLQNVQCCGGSDGRRV